MCETCLYLGRGELDAIEKAAGEADAIAMMCEALAAMRSRLADA